MTEQYNQQIGKYERLLLGKQRRFNLLGYGKLLMLLLLAGAVYLVYAEGFSMTYAVLAGVLFVILVALWLYHIKVHDEVDFCSGIIRINRQYLDRISGKWSGFADTGEEFAHRDHPYACDLDVVGPKSLFQMLNVTKTWHGRKAFSDDLLQPDYSAGEIRARQQAIQELSLKTEFISTFQYRASKIGADASVLKMIETLSDETSIIRSSILRWLLLWVPVFIAALSCAAVLLKLQALYIPSVVLLAAQGVFWIAGLSKTNLYLSSAAKTPYIFRHYAETMELLGKEKFDAPLLKSITASLTTSDTSAIRAMRELDAIVSKTHIKSSGILYFLLNVLLLWDYRCIVQLSAWKRKYGNSCEGWFRKLGEVESLLSFSGLVGVCSSSMPRISEERRMVRGLAMGHPLLPNDSRVCNDIAMADDVYIISGSNMSGKTTFLRTVGVNLILARAGSAVCAREMECALFHVMSSMRIADDLNEGISTFYAELKRIKGIIDGARERKNLLFLIDEIFRGTNSEDRLLGASTVIRELSNQGVMGIITTHDLALCELESRCSNIKNYSFSEQYTDNEMHFDYRIRQGKSRTTNARFLMRKVGILAPGSTGD